MENKNKIIVQSSFGIIIILSGILLNYFQIGTDNRDFLAVGTWLIYIGFFLLILIAINFSTRKKVQTDERTNLIGMKAARITYLSIILFLFATIIIDGIKPISTEYTQFATTFLCFISAVYFITYEILNRRN